LRKKSVEHCQFWDSHEAMTRDLMTFTYRK